MLASTRTATLLGVKGMEVRVEVSTSQGLPNTNTIGQGDQSVREAPDRVRAAIVNSSFAYPGGRVVINLVPASVKKRGSHFDLPIAIGVLMSEKIIDERQTEGMAFIGELSLTGEVVGVSGVMPMIYGLFGKAEEIFVPRDNLKEAYFTARDKGIRIRPAGSLREVVESILGRIPPEYYKFEGDCSEALNQVLDYSDVKGHPEAKEAITIAVSGGHGLLMIGSPGTGKTMLAERIPTILPPMTPEEILETSMVYSLIGRLDDARPVISERPFQTMCTRDTEVSILGGGNEPQPGLVSLANNGILYVDELLELKRNQIECLRKPIETGSVSFVRKGVKYSFPAHFTMISATNPCPCGNFGDKDRVCTCTRAQIERYQSKLSGPFMDRIDMSVEVLRIDYERLTEEKSLSSAEMGEKVLRAREIQAARFRSLPYKLNSQLDAAGVEEYCRLGTDEKEFMRRAYEYYKLNPRRYHKILKLGRTMADIGGGGDISVMDLSNALMYTRFLKSPDDTENPGRW